MHEQITMLNVKQLMAKLNISKTTIYALVKLGELPSPVRIGGSARWMPDEIASYIEKNVTNQNQSLNAAVHVNIQRIKANHDK